MQIEKKGSEAKVEMQMTPMIDIVFQLLTFFIMSFKIVAAEGDFDIKMPLAAKSEGLPPDTLPPMKVRLTATTGGQLNKIRLNDNDFGLSFDGLHNYIISVIGDERGPGSVQATAEVELDCDPQLHYQYVIKAITAVSGYTDADGNIVKLVEKIRFTPPKSRAG
ncbi:MAG TPA: biopolymer transporter ExbD [Candidatus Anammoximicrobium sp.]|nr:biopolymer transporter ExbD [Candidatus Anammoximicrobium sp.]